MLRAFAFTLCGLCVISISANRARAASPDLSVPACGSAIVVSLDGAASQMSHDLLLRWISRAGAAVCTYYGKFPVPHPHLHIHVDAATGVDHGVTYPDDGGTIYISVGAQTSQSELDSDWQLTHELLHLAFPSLPRRHHWLEEGIAVYVEPIARVQAGQLTAETMWHDVMRDMPQGQPRPGDQGLDHTHSWGRTYWGGAIFCLLADVRIRQQTRNQKGLQDALRGILDAGGTIVNDWSIEQALAAGDKATGTTVLTDLYKQMGSAAKDADLDALWDQLGVARAPDGSVHFVENAPLADVRRAITRAP